MDLKVSLTVIDLIEMHRSLNLKDYLNQQTYTQEEKK